MLLETSNDYTESDLTDLWIELNKDVDITKNLTEHYINNYSELCVPLTGRELPFKQKISFPTLDLYPLVLQHCNPNINNSIAGVDLDLTFPLFKFYKGDFK